MTVAVEEPDWAPCDLHIAVRCLEACASTREELRTRGNEAGAYRRAAALLRFIAGEDANEPTCPVDFSGPPA